MYEMLPYEFKAINNVAAHAIETFIPDKKYIYEAIKSITYGINAQNMVEQLLCQCDVTLNFHPDRYSNNGK